MRHYIFMDWHKIFMEEEQISHPPLPPPHPIPGVGDHTEHGDGIDTLGWLFAGQLHHSLHDPSKGLPDLLGHPSTGYVLHPWPSLNHTSVGGNTPFHIAPYFSDARYIVP